MLGYLTLIFVCQLAGELVAVATGWPVPGPVIGMVLLLVGLVLHGRVPDECGSVADSLLSNLSLLFVPAGVGVMQHARLIGHELLPISVALLVSTVLTIAVTGLIMAWLDTTQPRAGGGGHGSRR
jgi:holin-like protein